MSVPYLCLIEIIDYIIQSSQKVSVNLPCVGGCGVEVEVEVEVR